MKLEEFLEKESIRKLRYAYSARLDARDFDKLAALFAPDFLWPERRFRAGDLAEGRRAERGSETWARD